MDISTELSASNDRLFTRSAPH